MKRKKKKSTFKLKTLDQTKSTYGFDGKQMNNVFTFNIGLLAAVLIFPVILPGSFKLSRKPSSGCWVPSKSEIGISITTLINSSLFVTVSL